MQGRMATYWIGLFFYLASYSVAYAQKVTGKVLTTSHAGVPFASVQQIGSARGTITNERGEFNLNVTSLPCQLLVSSVGYQSQKVTVETNKQPVQITLTKGLELAEVVVMPDTTLKHLLRKAYQKIPQNYPNTSFGLDGFYRELHTGIPDELLYYGEAYLNLFSNGYRATGEDTQIRIVKSRINKNSTRDSVDHTRWYGGPFIANWNDPVKQRASFIQPSSFNKKYHYSLSAITTYNNDSVYVIRFNSRDQLEKINGKLWLDKKTLAYVKISYQNGSLDPVGLLSSVDRLNRSFESTYIQEQGVWHLAYTMLKGTYYNRKTKKQSAHDLLFVTTQFTASAEPIPYEQRLAYGAIFSDLDRNNDADFWQNYTSFEADSSLRTKLTDFQTVSKERTSQSEPRAISGSISTATPKKSSKQKIYAVLSRLSFGYSAGVALYGNHDPVYAATIQGQLLDNRSGFPASKLIPIGIGTYIGFRLTNRWSVSVSSSNELLANQFYSVNQLAIKARQLIRKRGNPLFLYGLAGIGSLKEGYLLTKLDRPDGYTVLDKRFSGGIQVFYADKSWAFVSGIGLAFLKKRREYFIESNQYVLLDKTPFLRFQETGKLFNKKADAGLNDTEFGVSATTSTQLTRPITISFGVKWHF